jgi:hypothetical protein
MEELLSAATALPPVAPRGGSSWPMAEVDLDPEAVVAANCYCMRSKALVGVASLDPARRR